MEEAVLRPKGVWFFCNISFWFLVFAFILLSPLVFIGEPLSKEVDETWGIFAVLIVCAIISAIAIIWKRYQIVQCKIMLTDSKIYVPVSKDLFLKRHEKKGIRYEGIVKIRCYSTIWPYKDTRSHMVWAKIITIERTGESKKKKSTFDVSWFSKKQRETIMAIIQKMPKE